MNLHRAVHKMAEPKNETHLAAELYAARPNKMVTPGRCAMVAAELCALGRTYKRLSERLCGGEEEWGRYPGAESRIAACERRRDRVHAKIDELVKPWGKRASVDHDGGGLLRVVETRASNGLRYKTALL